MRSQGTRTLSAVVVLTLVGAVLGWFWIFCRVYVEPGHMLVLTANFGDENPNPAVYTVVDEGVQGIQRVVLGEGRHFYNPVVYDRDTSKLDVDVGPLQVGIVESQWGTPLPEGEFLADPGQRGILKEVLTPGRYRINPFAYKVKLADAVVIRPGFVGCVTSQWGENAAPGALANEGERGIRAEVLQPGIYYMNPRAYRVQPIEVGYRNIEFADVEFPSRDGFPIKVDSSVIWGIQPRNVPLIVDRFGSVEDVIKKVIKPQVQSICRIEGSKYGAKEFIEGKTREQFQDTFTSALEKVCAERHLDVSQALLRNIEIPAAVRTPIQKSKIAAEERLTKMEQRKTQEILNDLEELRADVTKGEREVDAQTEKEVASIRAEGDRSVAKLAADKEVAVSVIHKEVAGVAAEKDRTLGRADAEVTKEMARARADKLKQITGALGGGRTYASYEFVRRLPEDFEIRLRYAGEGTLWTDLGDAEKLRDAAAVKVLKRKSGRR